VVEGVVVVVVGAEVREKDRAEVVVDVLILTKEMTVAMMTTIEEVLLAAVAIVMVLIMIIMAHAVILVVLPLLEVELQDTDTILPLLLLATRLLLVMILFLNPTDTQVELTLGQIEVEEPMGVLDMVQILQIKAGVMIMEQQAVLALVREVMIRVRDVVLTIITLKALMEQLLRLVLDTQVQAVQGQVDTLVEQVDMDMALMEVDKNSIALSISVLHFSTKCERGCCQILKAWTSDRYFCNLIEGKSSIRFIERSRNHQL